MQKNKRLNPAQRVTYRQILFCQSLLLSPRFNAKQAAIMAGYSKKTSASQASRLLKRPIIQLYRSLYITELRHESAPDPQSKRQRLSAKQQLFMFAYMHWHVGGRPMNGKEAAIYAGYSPKTAVQTASRLLKHPEIKANIESWRGGRKSLGELLERRLKRLADGKRL